MTQRAYHPANLTILCNFHKCASHKLGGIVTDCCHSVAPFMEYSAADIL